MPQGWTEIWLVVAFIGMVIGVVILGVRAIAHRHREGMEFSMVSFFVCLWAACMYLSMSSRSYRRASRRSSCILGTLSRLDCHHTTATPRSRNNIRCATKVDWRSYWCRYFHDRHGGLLPPLTTPSENFIWYIISCGAFVALLWALLSEYSATAKHRDPKVNSLFSTLRNLLTVLWICYPIVWILGAQGIEIIDTTWEAFFYAVLDVTAKVIFGIILTSASATTLAKASNSEREMRAAKSYVQGYQGE